MSMCSRHFLVIAIMPPSHTDADLRQARSLSLRPGSPEVLENRPSFGLILWDMTFFDCWNLGVTITTITIAKIKT